MPDETGGGGGDHEVHEQEMGSKHILLEAPAAEVNLENIHVRGKNIEKDLGGKGRQNCLMY
jgi:hypothetical protein